MTQMLASQSMSAQLAEASLPVPDEIDTDTIFKTSLEQCLAEKGSQASKRTAADAKGAKQAAGACMSPLTPLHVPYPMQN